MNWHKVYKTRRAHRQHHICVGCYYHFTDKDMKAQGSLSSPLNATRLDPELEPRSLASSSVDALSHLPLPHPQAGADSLPPHLSPFLDPGQNGSREMLRSAKGLLNGTLATSLSLPPNNLDSQQPWVQGSQPRLNLTTLGLADPLLV